MYVCITMSRGHGDPPPKTRFILTINMIMMGTWGRISRSRKFGSGNSQGLCEFRYFVGPLYMQNEPGSVNQTGSQS